MQTPRALPPVEIYTPERIAEFLLNNSVTKEGYDEACSIIREEYGLDPEKIPHMDRGMREELMSRAEFDLRWGKVQESRGER
jgi:hypothetical protein